LIAVFQGFEQKIAKTLDFRFHLSLLWINLMGQEWWGPLNAREDMAANCITN
jgi:hypothetical protein